MTKFINIDNDTVINISEIEGIQRELYEVSRADFKGQSMETGKVTGIDYREFVLAKIFLKTNRTIEVNTLIYSDEDFVDQINKNWETLISALDCKEINL